MSLNCRLINRDDVLYTNIQNIFEIQSADEKLPFDLTNEKLTIVLLGKKYALIFEDHPEILEFPNDIYHSPTIPTIEQSTFELIPPLYIHTGISKPMSSYVQAVDDTTFLDERYQSPNTDKNLIKDKLTAYISREYPDIHMYVDIHQLINSERTWYDLVYRVLYEGYEVRVSDPDIIQGFQQAAEEHIPGILLATSQSFIQSPWQWSSDSDIVIDPAYEHIPAWYWEGIFKDTIELEFFPGITIPIVSTQTWPKDISNEFQNNIQAPYPINAHPKDVLSFCGNTCPLDRQMQLYVYLSSTNLRMSTINGEVYVYYIRDYPSDDELQSIYREIRSRMSMFFKVQTFPRNTPPTYIKSRNLRQLRNKQYVPINISSLSNKPLICPLIYEATMSIKELFVFLMLIGKLAGQMDIYYYQTWASIRYTALHVDDYYKVLEANLCRGKGYTFGCISSYQPSSEKIAQISFKDQQSDNQIWLQSTLQV